MSYADKARRPDGSLRPYSEVAEVELRAKTAARYAQIHSERETEAAKSETQKRVEHFQGEYDHARRNDSHARAKFLKTHLDTLKDQLASERAAESKARQFAADPRIALIRGEADLIERSGHTLLPHAAQVDRDVLVSVARSESYPDPESQWQDYKQLADRLTDVELEAERVKQGDATIEAARQAVTLADSLVQQSELELLRVKREAVADES
jgi:hypothetical protein